MDKKVTEVVEAFAQPIVEELNLELVDVEYVQEGQDWFLRVFIDSEKGVDIEECGAVSERLSEALDKEDQFLIFTFWMYHLLERNAH